MVSDNSNETNEAVAQPDTNGTTPVNASRDMVSIEQDISRLSAILSGSGANSEEELDERSLAELFKQLEGATGLMNGVEDKLDNILGNLDGLLAALEDQKVQEAKLEDEKVPADK
ncbi:hypothetical protein VKT23_006640 [Stygiomarasmius scandens]|uniref:Heat shock factor binding protein 1 n=1 Tax=Marasmiellus scandens TaxID=2682957 RepID=A0ABR1JNF5_9AGAR